MNLQSSYLCLQCFLLRCGTASRTKHLPLRSPQLACESDLLWSAVISGKALKNLVDPNSALSVRDLMH